MDLELTSRVVLVTGGASGIGAAIARRLFAEGAVPVILDRNGPLAEEVATQLSIDRTRGDWEAADLTDDEATRRAVAAVMERHGRLDGVVNNAGLNDRAGFHENVDAFRASLERNLVQVFHVTQLCLPALRRAPGAAVVNVASKVAFTGQGGTSGYAAAKGGVAALTREWAVELAPDGIRVNCVLPAEVWTPLYERYLSALADPAARRQEIESRIPLGQRMTTPDEIADAVVFLLSPRSGHTTGQWHFVDGGYTHLDRACALPGTALASSASPSASTPSP